MPLRVGLFEDMEKNMSMRRGIVIAIAGAAVAVIFFRLFSLRVCGGEDDGTGWAFLCSAVACVLGIQDAVEARRNYLRARNRRGRRAAR